MLKNSPSGTYLVTYWKWRSEGDKDDLGENVLGSDQTWGSYTGFSSTFEALSINVSNFFLLHRGYRLNGLVYRKNFKESFLKK